jgi:hypothetical protein
MNRFRNPTSRLLILSGASTLALSAAVAAGCGSAASSAPGPNASSSGGAPPSRGTGADDHRLAAIKYARCMRGHGVNVLDPDQNGNIQIAAPDTPKAVIDRAQNACRQLRSAAVGPGLNAKQHAQALAQFTKFTHCMRGHQIPMADPITGPNGAVGFYVPQGISPTSKRYTDAEASCKHLLPNATG